ncbi:MAG: oligoendopeptidase F [Anaerolineales bacterium]|nr:oligoendopeptidase F [Anaerolineales bacterium]
MAQVTPTREEIPVEHTWDTDSIFASVDEWKAAIAKLDAQLAALSAYKGRLHEGPATLADYLEKSEEMSRNLGKIYVYGSLNYSVNTMDQEAAGRNDQGRGTFGKAAAAVAFDEPELLAIGFDTLNKWMAEEPRLAPYAHYFSQLEQRHAHVRSAEVEQVLGMARDAFGTASATHGILANADLKFTPAKDSEGNKYDITQGSLRALLGDTDRTLRRSAWENYADGHLAFKNTMANALAAGIKQNVFNARVRGYKDALDAAMSGSYIPTEVFHNLIATFKKNLPTWHRYWDVRRKMLGVDKLYEYDIKAPLTDNGPEVTYSQAVEWIAAGLSPLGDEYVSVLKQGALKNRWVDIYPNKGKRMGAFSSGVPGTNPFIMMSYTDDLFGMSTLAHELGHSMHSYFTWQNQKIFSYCRYGLFVAEVASNFNQAMVRDYLFKTQPDRDFQIAIIEEAMANFHRYFFIMPMLAQFELEIHRRVERGEALSADSLIDLLAQYHQEGYGDALDMEHDRSGITWAMFHTHLYANFYVYKYATGISAANALSQKILTGEANAVENYLSFLKAGGSMYPLDALKVAGIDMTTPQPVEAAFDVLAGLVDRLEQLVS